MKLEYDLHLHSCLSPCGGDDMTPYNLVNMAALLGLQIIALTDHNSAGNCRSAMAVGQRTGVVVVPGMELCTSEEIHVVCLFPDIERAEAFSDDVHATLPPIQNKAEVFGRQLYMDDADRMIGEEELLLVNASGIGLYEVPGLMDLYGGFAFPAHIDRPSYSVISSLGTIDADMGFCCAELTRSADAAALAEAYPDLGEMAILRSSDAHYLENMTEAAGTIHLPENTSGALIAYLRGLTAASKEF